MPAKGRKQRKKYSVQATLRALEVHKNTGKAILVEVSRPGRGILGKLEIGRGSIRWYATDAKKPTRTLNWSRFAEWMEKRDR